MVTKILLFILVVCTPLLVNAGNDSLFTKANGAYSAGKFKEARDLYESIIAGGFESSELYLNLGNTCFRLKEYGWARLYYEKSRHLDPFNQDSFSNLELVRSYSPDKITVLPQISVKMAFLTGFSFFKTWTFIFFLVLFTILTLYVVYKWFDNGFSGIKKYSAVTLLIFTLLVQVLAGLWVVLEKTTRTGVIVSNVADVRSEPVESGATLFTLHMGTLVFIDSDYHGWLSIRLENGNTGWIPEKLIGKVN